jgi:hypothetical protein
MVYAAGSQVNGDDHSSLDRIIAGIVDTDVDLVVENERSRKGDPLMELG